jgi:hypothetical protein
MSLGDAVLTGEQMRGYTAHLRDICDDLVRLGF